MEVGDWREAQSAVSKHEGGDMRRFLPGAHGAEKTIHRMASKKRI